MNDATTRRTAARWQGEGRPAVVVEVIETRGSVPRPTGTRMVVSADQVAGTIGGGHLEWKAIDAARRLLASPDRSGPERDSVERLHFPLGPALGQCCGGIVTLALAALDAERLASWPEPAPRFHLQLYGAGHVGRAIAALLVPLDVRVDWIDERESEFPARLGSAAERWPGHVRKVCVDAVEAEVETAPPGAYYLVLTHQHDLDLRICEAILRRGDFGFLGLIGSKTKRERFLHRFEARGFAPETIARVTCPIGIAGIEGKEPEVIAVAVVAQLLERASLKAP